jgi:hypothetical protein
MEKLKMMAIEDFGIKERKLFPLVVKNIMLIHLYQMLR